MKKHLPTLCFLTLSIALSAQKLPVKTATIFKNNTALLDKAGKVPVKDGRYSVTELPDALFGTYWVAGADLQSVFAAMDSVETANRYFSTADVLRKNLGKPVILYLPSGTGNDMVVAGTAERIFNDQNPGFEQLLVKVKDGGWATVNINQIRRYDFTDRPDLNIRSRQPQKHLDLKFKGPKTEQEVTLSYLAAKLGWTPVYRLEMTGKNQGRLSMRAEIVNDAEDLGDAELRLAVGIPNFTFADRLSQLVTFDPEVRPLDYRQRVNLMSNAIQSQNAYGWSEVQEVTTSAGGEGQVEGSQAEDFYFYTIRPGNFPKNSRYQHPVFETEIQPAHCFESVLPPSNAQRPTYYQERTGQPEEKTPVTHYVEFKNTTNYPWTTGAANLLSQNKIGRAHV
mgnify:CR=1 FL=1